MEWLVQILAILLTLLLAVVKSMSYTPDGTDEAALKRRTLLPTYIALRTLKEIVFITLIFGLLLTTHDPLAGSLLGFLYLLLAKVVAARGWLGKMVWQLQQTLEPSVQSLVAAVAPVVQVLAPQVQTTEVKMASKEELHHLIAKDENVLAPGEKQHLLAALDFARLKIGDCMVLRAKIHTVATNETVGPLLLDRLHKQGHNVFPVVKKDLDHIQGLLYMRDLVPLDPELKEVADAVRPTVHYIFQGLPLEQVLSASLQTGRQLFIVVDDKGNTVGLITLRDAVARLLGAAPPDENHSTTDPKKVNQK